MKKYADYYNCSIHELINHKAYIVSRAIREGVCPIQALKDYYS